jgi:aminoglycoside 3-N-acetyltransferase I
MSEGTNSVRVRILDTNQVDDFIRLVKIFEKVFEMGDFQIPDRSHLSMVLSKDGFRAVVAEINNVIIGGATLYTLDQYYSTKPLAYLYDLAVLDEHQRKGIGRKIIEYIKVFYHSKGFEEVYVQADEVDDYALDFYRSTQPTEEEKVRHFYYLLNKKIEN